MTDMNTLKSHGVYALTVLKGTGGDTLAVGIKPPYRDKPQYRRLLETDFARYREFDHQNILKYHELKETDGLGPCLVMEWESARPLADYVAEGHSEAEKKAIVVQVADALRYMHSRRCVHAALTPGAIFVTTKDDSVKVLNFRQRYADGLKQSADSLRFIAPEAKDGTVTLDARADIFSLGQLMRYLGMPPAYRAVTDGCCSFGRSERYADVDTFLAALNGQRLPRASARHTGGASASVAANSRMVRLLTAVVAVLALAVGVCMLGMRLMADRAETPQPATLAADTVATADAGGANVVAAAEQVFLDSLMPQVRSDLDGIYDNAKGRKTAARRVTRYYKGLRKVLVGRGASQAQLDAFDRAFGEYNQQKKSQ